MDLVCVGDYLHYSHYIAAQKEEKVKKRLK